MIFKQLYANETLSEMQRWRHKRPSITGYVFFFINVLFIKIPNHTCEFCFSPFLEVSQSLLFGHFRSRKTSCYDRDITIFHGGHTWCTNTQFRLHTSPAEMFTYKLMFKLWLSRKISVIVYIVFAWPLNIITRNKRYAGALISLGNNRNVTQSEQKNLKKEGNIIYLKM